MSKRLAPTYPERRISVPTDSEILQKYGGVCLQNQTSIGYDGRMQTILRPYNPEEIAFHTNEAAKTKAEFNETWDKATLELEPVESAYSSVTNLQDWRSQCMNELPDHIQAVNG